MSIATRRTGQERTDTAEFQPELPVGVVPSDDERVIPQANRRALPWMTTIGAAQKNSRPKDQDILAFWVHELEVRPEMLTWMDLLQAAADLAGNPTDDTPKTSLMIQMAADPSPDTPPRDAQRHLIRLIRSAIRDTQQRARRLVAAQEGALPPEGTWQHAALMDEMYSQALKAAPNSRPWTLVGNAIKADWNDTLFRGMSGALISVVLRASGPETSPNVPGMWAGLRGSDPEANAPDSRLFVGGNRRRTDKAGEQVFGSSEQRWLMRGHSLRIQLPSRPYPIHTVSDASLIWGRYEQIRRDVRRGGDAIRLSAPHVAQRIRDSLIPEVEQRIAQGHSFDFGGPTDPWTCNLIGQWKDSVCTVRRLLNRHVHLMMAVALSGLGLDSWRTVGLGDDVGIGPPGRLQRMPADPGRPVLGRYTAPPTTIVGHPGGRPPSPGVAQAQMDEFRQAVARVVLQHAAEAQDPTGLKAALERADERIIQETGENSQRYFFGHVDLPKAQIWVDIFARARNGQDDPDLRADWCGAMGMKTMDAWDNAGERPAARSSINERFWWGMAFALGAKPDLRIRLAARLAETKVPIGDPWMELGKQVARDMASLGMTLPNDWMDGMDVTKASAGQSLSAVVRAAYDRFAFQLQDVVLGMDGCLEKTNARGKRIL